MNKTIYIGIDPDHDKSGFAIWYKNDKYLELYLLRFFDIYDKMIGIITHHDKNAIQVIIEGGHRNKKSNFHHKPGQSKNVSERISKNVGMNHEVGIKLMEMMQHFKVDAAFKIPKRSKTRPAMFKLITGIETENQEEIDAGMLVFGC